MSSPRPHESLLCRVLSGPLTPELSSELDIWLREDPEHREILAQFMLLEDMLVAVRKESAATSVLSLLAEMEENAEPLDHLALPAPDRRTQAGPANQLTGRELLAAGSYVLRHSLSPKVIAVLATAAAVLLGVVLAIVFLTGGPDDEQPIADAPETPEQPGPADEPIVVQPVVATLTAEYGAAWDRRPGGVLYAGERLTLIRGFAEVTTRRGAVALLEAPCTIEMIHDNAIRLERGRLVGIVESEQAKGFFVRTPQMDVVDLGTRFGVEADPRGNRSVVYVFDGLVEASPLYTDGGQDKPVRLEADQGLVARAGRDLRMAEIDPTRFVSDPAVLPYLIETGETARFLGLDRPGSLMPGALESSRWMHVVLEQTGVNVAEGLTAGITEPGTYRSFVGPGDPVAYEGRVDSYLAHLDPVGKEKSVTLSGEITFPRPVIAVLVNNQQLSATDPLFAHPGTELYRNAIEPLGLDGVQTVLDAEQIDELVLSEDRRTLRYRLFALQPFDEFRVLIEAAEQKP